MAKTRKLTEGVTERVIEEMDRIVGRKNGTKLTDFEFAESIGLAASNLSRLRTTEGYYATVEVCCLLIKKYGTDPVWLMTGKKPAPRINPTLAELIETSEKQAKEIAKIKREIKQYAVH